MIVFFKLIYYLLFKGKIALINSPLQFINFIEFCNINKKYNPRKIPILVGYTVDAEVQRIKKINKILKLNYNLFYLEENINIYFIHFILKLRKLLVIKYDNCIIGDLKYYLHREYFKLSKKKNVLDDGTSSFGIKKLFKNILVTNTVFFTIFDNIKLKKIKVIKNNYLFLKKKYDVKKKISNDEIHFISSKLHENIKNSDLVFKFIEKLAKSTKKKVFYIPHPKEKLRPSIRKLQIRILKLDIPIELYYLNKYKLPSKIILNYSTSCFTLNKIFKNYKGLENFSFKNNSIFKIDEHKSSFRNFDKELKKLKIKIQTF
tara:strand:- start:3923 stop:4873 length:951 start_codon:yes stop_codon:yes gene_type:complete